MIALVAFIQYLYCMVNTELCKVVQYSPVSMAYKENVLTNRGNLGVHRVVRIREVLVGTHKQT